jgi:hypothetical protein
MRPLGSQYEANHNLNNWYNERIMMIIIIIIVKETDIKRKTGKVTKKKQTKER